VCPQSDVEIYIPMRVVSNGSGSELLLTLFRLPEMTDEKFAADAQWVMRDLAAVKNLLERGEPDRETGMRRSLAINTEN
jgi:hypothetical protein